MNRYIITMASGKEYVKKSIFNIHENVKFIILDDEYYTDRKTVIFTKHIESIEQVDSVVE